MLYGTFVVVRSVTTKVFSDVVVCCFRLTSLSSVPALLKFMLTLLDI